MVVSNFIEAIRARFTGARHEYSAVPGTGGEDGEQRQESREQSPRPDRPRRWSPSRLALLAAATAAGMIAVGVAFHALRGALARTREPDACDDPRHGFQCAPEMSHHWGQYAPFFAVPSDMDPAFPLNCDVTFVQALSRHGARDPTSGKSGAYRDLLARIQASATSYGPGFGFLQAYEYALGADQLTAFGRREMANAGASFYRRYQMEAREVSPFVRASDQNRVVESARNWTMGFHQAKLLDPHAKGKDTFPYDILQIPEATGFNNTLSHGECKAFEEGTASNTGDVAKGTWAAVFTPAITDRLNDNLPGANLTTQDTLYLMDLCPFGTVAAPDGTISPFCNLFTQDDWRNYDYYQTLGKYYSYGPGNPLGPTQGVGFVNELLARLTRTPVQDHTTTNGTLDSDPATFPLDMVLYADFSHDNEITAILAALGLYNNTAPLSNTTRQEPRDAGGYAASWTVPFGSRLYVEKVSCQGRREELVRILVNERVVSPPNCGADSLGWCSLDKFVDSLDFARRGGKWDAC